jgi:hypothetical protein
MGTAGSKDTNEVCFKLSTENLSISKYREGILIALYEAEADSDNSPFGGYAMLHHWQDSDQRRIAA